MRRRISSLTAAVLVATAVAVLGPAAPASALGACVGTLLPATTAAPLFYPVTVDTTGPPTTVAVTQTAPVFTTFMLGVVPASCVNVSPPALKFIGAAGVVWGWCGHASGSGATVDGHRFAFVSVGTLLVLTGGLTGVVSATPDILAGESCNPSAADPTGPGAEGFILTGAVVKMHCGLLKSKTTTVVPIPIPPFFTATTSLSVTVAATTTGGAMAYFAKVCVPGAAAL